MRRRWTTLLSLLLTLQWGHAQEHPSDNMVFNPSFEEHSTCPDRIDALGTMSQVDAWWQPTRGSSDYFHPCGGRECQTPRNKMGFQAAHGGEAYCGIYCSQENYREYLQTELRQPLVAGARYRVTLWVSLADKAPHAIATLGLLFTRERPADTTWGILMHRQSVALDGNRQQVIATPYRPQVVNPVDSLLADSREWHEVSGEFVAAGGERFLTIGNFCSFNRSNVVATGAGNAVLPGAYYYIDDVSVRCLDCDSLPVVAVADTVAPPQPGDLLTLRNILFDTDKSDLLPPSYKELRQLVDLLRRYPTMRIELRGHTDNQGTAAHNLRLSEARAKAVAVYLVNQGIDHRRVSWVGFGKSQPIDTNDTDEGRQNNRRVECLIVER